jgi:hypothetical protein
MKQYLKIEIIPAGPHPADYNRDWFWQILVANPDEDWEQLRSGFCGSYEEAAAEVREYLRHYKVKGVDA